MEYTEIELNEMEWTRQNILRNALQYQSQAIPDKIHGNSITNNKAKDEGKRKLLVLLYIIWINTFWNLNLVDIAFNNGALYELDLTQHAKNNKYYISWSVMYFDEKVAH